LDPSFDSSLFLTSKKLARPAVLLANKSEGNVDLCSILFHLSSHAQCRKRTLTRWGLASQSTSRLRKMCSQSVAPLIRKNGMADLALALSPLCSLKQSVPTPPAVEDSKPIIRLVRLPIDHSHPPEHHRTAKRRKIDAWKLSSWRGAPVVRSDRRRTPTAFSLAPSLALRATQCPLSSNISRSLRKLSVG
jgi:hypothetical protein